MAKHKPKTVLCFVQFKGVYLATPQEVGKRLKESRDGEGETILKEHHVWKSETARGAVDKMPKQRVEDLLRLMGVLAC